MFDAVEGVAQTRVAEGAKFLDERVPGWRNRIDTDRLSIKCAGRCVLGQLYGSYDKGVRELGLSLGDHGTIKLGFNTDNQARFADLDVAWRTEIVKPALAA